MLTESYICGIGSYVPPRVVDNFELETIVETSDEWIRTRTGIAERHYLESGANSSDSGAAAARSALKMAGLTPDDVTHILCATCTPDFLSPSNACVIAGKLGCTPAARGGKGVMAFDLNAACTGFIYGLETARAILQLHPDATILLIAAEGLSRRINFADRTTCVLFGDAGGAAVIRSNTVDALWRIADAECSSDGSLSDLINIGGGSAAHMEVGTYVDPSYFIKMNGTTVFKHAVRCMAEESASILKRNGIAVSELGMFIPHQANLRIIDAVGIRLGISESQVYTNVQKYGNTSAVSLPLAIDEALSTHVLGTDKSVLLTSFGAGMTWGSALLLPA